MSISSIDDLLMGIGNSLQPATPEHKEKIQETPEPVEEMEDDDADVSDEHESLSEEEDDDVEPDESEQDEVPSKIEEDETDEYGNEKERLPKGMKDRLDRKEKQYQQEVAQRDYEIQQLRQQLANKGASKEVQQAVKDFEYNPNEEVPWEKQLSDFVKQTVKGMNAEQQNQQRQMQEERAEREFSSKFRQGMGRFNDFEKVVGAQPIDNPMTLALRGMNDPSAFIYAASKRHPGELERISKITDDYAKIVEMGKLEERMRRNKPTTKTPRPLGRLKEDSTARVTPKQKETTGDDLLAKADAKRLTVVKNRHGRNR